MNALKNRNVVVVGGSRGVGRAIVRAVASEGATVLVTARGDADLALLAAEIPGVKTLALDAAHEEAPARTFAALEPDVLVVCVGAVAASGPLQSLTWQEFSVNWETDAKAAFLFCGAALRTPMKPGGRIILISSGAAITGGPPFAGSYGAAKRAQRLIAGYSQKESDRLGLELCFTDLEPRHIMPGTGVGDAGIAGYADYTGQPAAQILSKMTETQTPEDVARAVVHMSAADMTPGAYVVDGKGLAAVE